MDNSMRLIFAMSNILRVSYPMLNELHDAAAVDHPHAAAAATAPQTAAEAPQVSSASQHAS